MSIRTRLTAGVVILLVAIFAVMGVVMAQTTRSTLTAQVDADVREQSARLTSPVDNKGQKVDLTMAFVGTRDVFERAGFTKEADTDAVAGGFPRVLMRLALS